MTTIVATRLFEYIRRSEHKKLCRTCRLVCRDWAGQFPLGFSEPWNLRVEDGAAWYRFDAEWIHLPNGRWAWSFQDFSNEWWVEGWSEPGKHCQWYLKVTAAKILFGEFLVDDCVLRSSCSQLMSRFSQIAPGRVGHHQYNLKPPREVSLLQRQRSRRSSLIIFVAGRITNLDH